MTATLCTDEIKPLVEKLVNAHPVNLTEVDPDRILFLRGKGKRKPVTIATVRNPWDLVTSFKFVLTVHGPKYDHLDDNKKAIAVFDELLRIKDFDNGTLKPHAVVGSYETIATWGINWLEEDDLAPIFKTDEQKKA